MDRRVYLGSLAGIGTTGLAGCLERLNVFSDTELAPPEQDLSETVHPTHGDEFPSFSIPDPLADRDVTRDEFVGERAMLMTFIYTSCTDDCGALVNMLQQVQEDAAERGYEDDVALLAMTFDPEIDDPETLHEYGERYDVDYDAGNWHFLRPETEEEALELVNDTFGSPTEVRAPEEGHDHGDHGNEDHGSEDDADGNETDADDDNSSSENGSDDGEEYITHYYMIFLVNEDGIVERAYPNAPTRTRPIDLLEDTRTVVE